MMMKLLEPLAVDLETAGQSSHFLISLEQGHADSHPGELVRSGKPGESSTDNDDMRRAAAAGGRSAPNRAFSHLNYRRQGSLRRHSRATCSQSQPRVFAAASFEAFFIRHGLFH
jgi:hypothetical protein